AHYWQLTPFAAFLQCQMVVLIVTPALLLWLGALLNALSCLIVPLLRGSWLQAYVCYAIVSQQSLMLWCAHLSGRDAVLWHDQIPFYALTLLTALYALSTASRREGNLLYAAQMLGLSVEALRVLGMSYESSSRSV